MIWRLLKREEGQSLVQVSLMIMALLGLVSIAVDVGNAYAERRRMQNAADAAALAGAYELCKLSSDETAIARAEEYLTSNGADLAACDVSIDGHIVNATAGITVNTFLAGVVGFPTLNVGASAAAACGAATSGCGLWPIAFSESLWEEFYDGGGGCGKQFAVWADNNEAQQPVCVVGGVTQNNICNCYDCDNDNDGTDDFAVLFGEGRAWLDYSEAVLPYTDSCTAPGCGATELGCHISNDSGSKIDLPKCISGDSGVKAGVKDNVESRAGDDVSIALYDSVGCSTSNCPGGQTYHVNRLGCIEVVGWEQNFQLNEIADPKKKVKGKVIWVKMNCGNECTTACGSTNGEPPVPWELTAANLIK